MKDMKYNIERCYPYVIALLLVLILIIFRIDFTQSKELTNALDSINTISALIIGFLGTMLPILLGLKNESKFVEQVFKKDNNKLFFKYINSTIMSGLILVFITVIMYFIKDFCNVCLEKFLFYIWVYFVLLFLLCTYRSLSCILNLFFINESDMINPLYSNNNSEKTEEEKEFEEENNL